MGQRNDARGYKVRVALSRMDHGVRAHDQRTAVSQRYSRRFVHKGVGLHRLWPERQPLRPNPLEGVVRLWEHHRLRSCL